MPNTILKRWNGTSFEELYPKTTVGQISASGTPNSTTFLRGDGQWATPTGSGVSGSGTTNELAYWDGSTSLGTLAVATYPSLTELSYVKGVTSAIQTQLNGKQATLTNPVTGTGTSNQITYWSGTGTVAALSTATYPSLTELSYVKGVTSAIQTQINAKADSSQLVDTYKATQTTANSTTPVTYHSVTLLAGHYYQIVVHGIWSKTATTNSVGAVVNVIANDLTGSPTFHGVFEWLQSSGATAYTIENNVVNLTTSGTTLAFTTTATTGSVSGTYWGMKGLIYTGTTVNKTITFQIATSAAPSTGTVALDRIAITAERLS